MELRRGGYEHLKLRLGEAIALTEAGRENSLLDALRRLSSSPSNPLRAYIVGEELVVAVDSYPLVSVNLRERRVRTWDDWRDRLATAARSAVDEVAKKLLTMLLDRGEEVPEPFRSELSRTVIEVGKSGGEELHAKLLKLRELLRELSQAGG